MMARACRRRYPPWPGDRRGRPLGMTCCTIFPSPGGMVALLLLVAVGLALAVLPFAWLWRLRRARRGGADAGSRRDQLLLAALAALVLAGTWLARR